MTTITIDWGFLGQCVVCAIVLGLLIGAVAIGREHEDHSD